MAVAQAKIQMPKIDLIARDRLDIVCARIGWQIATYLSTVKAVIVSTDAEDVISERNILKTQKGSPKTQGYASHIVYSSGGRPATEKKERYTVNFKV